MSMNNLPRPGAGESSAGFIFDQTIASIFPPDAMAADTERHTAALDNLYKRLNDVFNDGDGEGYPAQISALQSQRYGEVSERLRTLRLQSANLTQLSGESRLDAAQVGLASLLQPLVPQPNARAGTPGLRDEADLKRMLNEVRDHADWADPTHSSTKRAALAFYAGPQLLEIARGNPHLLVVDGFINTLFTPNDATGQALADYMKSGVPRSIPNRTRPAWLHY